MINYLERALSQAPADRGQLSTGPEDTTSQPLPAALALPPTAVPDPGNDLPPARSNTTERAAPEPPEPAPTPDALTRSLSRAAKTVPLEPPTAQGAEQSAPNKPVGAVTLPNGQDATPQTQMPGPTGQPRSGSGLALTTAQAPLRPASSPFDAARPLLTALSRSEAAADFVRQPARALTVTLPDAPAPTAHGLTPRELDRAVERDARRYDGGFSLY